MFRASSGVSSSRLRAAPAAVAFFETSFGRVYDRPFILVTLDEDGAQGLGECVADADPFYSAETTRRRGTSSRTSSRRWCSAATFAHPREVFPALARVRGHHMAKAAVEMAAWDLAARQQGVPLSRLLGGTRARRFAAGVSIGIQDSLDAARREGRARSSPPATGASRSRSSRAGTSRRSRPIRARFGDIPLMVDANAAYTLGDAAHLARARSVRPDDDRAAARLRRRPRSRGAAAADRDADLPRRIDPHGARRGGGDRARRVPHHQHQAGPRRRPRASRSACTTSAPRTASRCGTAACSRAASAARTTSTSRRCRTSRCRATSRPAAATSRRI